MRCPGPNANQNLSRSAARPHDQFTCNPILDLAWEQTMVCSSGWLESFVLSEVTEVTIRGLAIDYLATSTSVTAWPVPGAFNAYGIQLRYRAVDLEAPEVYRP